jgi:hypothetical protein
MSDLLAPVDPLVSSPGLPEPPDFHDPENPLAPGPSEAPEPGSSTVPVPEASNISKSVPEPEPGSSRSGLISMGCLEKPTQAKAAKATTLPTDRQT